MRKKLPFQVFLFALFIITGSFSQIYAQVVQIVPPACYSGNTPDQQDAAALADPTNIPFATWEAIHAYATDPANGVNTVNFAPGTYYPGGASGLSSQWGDAFGGFVIPADITVNGNGAVIDNSGNNNSIAFATIGGNNATLDGFTFIEFTGNNAGAVVVASGLTGWTISNCNFDHSDWAGDGLVVNQGAGSSGTISECNFYGHIQSTGSAMTVNGPGGTLDIINSTYSCNSRIVAGGAVRILAGANVDFDGCTFDGNETNSASGGAISIEGNSTATFNNTIFTCNYAIVNTQDDGGAMHIIEGSNVTLTGCTFKGNQAQDKGGAIHASGASASLITLDINNTTFDENSTITALSSGGAIYLNDANTTIDDSYFTLNTVNATNGEGGGVYVDIGNNSTTYEFNNNVFENNGASGDCTGIDVFTEMHISGSNNNLEHLADGHHLSEQAGSLEFSNGDDCDAVSNWTTTNSTVTSDGNFLTTKGPGLSFASQAESGSGKLYWTFTGYTASSMSGFSSGSRAMAFVLGGSDADFSAGDGIAIMKGRTGNAAIELVSYTGGLYGTLTSISNIVTPSSESGYMTFKVVYDPTSTTFTFYYTVGSSDFAANESDPRGYRYCASDGVSTMATASQSFDLSSYPNVGPAWSASSSSNQARWGSYYFRAGDETDANGASTAGSGVSATCSGCLTSSTAINQCPSTSVGSIQGDVFFDDNMDGIMNDGEQLAGIEVNLYDEFDNLIATTVTNADGHYIFTNLPDGNYYVEFGVPTGTTATSTMQNMGPAAFDSDVPGGITSTTFRSPIISIDTSTGMSDGADNFNNAANYYNVTAGYAQTILPITWSDLSARSENCQVRISWSTSLEVRNSHYVVERSNDNKNYTAINTLNGAGNSTKTNTYEVIDREKSNSTKTYYRIKQIDYDGGYSYSKIVSVSSNNCDEASTSVKVYPNPTENILNIEFGQALSNNETIEIFNSTGQVVFIQTFNRDQYNTNGFQINIQTLKSGVYFVRTSSNEEISRIIKI